jgi:hypothetical protein
MNKFLKATAVVASIFAANAASAAVVVFGGGPVPAATNKVQNADITAGVSVTATEILNPGDSAEFIFTALENLRVNTISLAGTGSNSGLDLADVTFGFTKPALDSFSLINNTGTAASALDFLPGLTMAAGDSFTIFWEDGVAFPVGLTASFTTTAVPVPAALPLMVGALGLLGVARRRAYFQTTGHKIAQRGPPL